MAVRVALLGVIWVLVGAACTTDPTANLVDPDDLLVGSCFEAEPEDGIVAGVEPVECAEPHSYELFAVAQLESRPAYPAPEEIAVEARNVCVPRLERYADVWAADGGFDFGYFYPSEDEWRNGDRRVACYLYDLGLDELTGSVRVVPPPARPFRSDLRPGQCFDAPPTEFVYTVPVVDCAEEHDFEVFEVFIAEDGPYPGVEQLEQLVAERCVTSLEVYSGGAAARGLTYSYWIPSTDGWDDGDRTVVCFAHRADGPSEGSVRRTPRSG